MVNNTSKRIAGMMYTRLENGIYVYRFSDNRRETIDAWYEQSHQDDLAGLAMNEHVSHMLDLRGQWMTPYAMARALQNARRTPPGLRESTAVIAGDGFIIGMIEGLIRQLPSSVRLSSRVFSTEDAALLWLKQRQQEFEAGNTRA